MEKQAVTRSGALVPICKMIRQAISISFLIIFSYEKSRACSTRPLSPEKLVFTADQIILVKVVGERDHHQVEMKVLEVLKGKVARDNFLVNGSLHYEGPNEEKAPYYSVRRGGRHGNCFASDYKKNGQFLMFFKNGRPNWAALAPTNEEVSGSDDPWVIWVKMQIKKQGT